MLRPILSFFVVFVTSFVSSSDIVDIVSYKQVNDTTEDDNDIQLSKNQNEGGGWGNRNSNISPHKSIHYHIDRKKDGNAVHDAQVTGKGMYYYVYRNAYSCPPCICYRREDNAVDADCTNRRLRIMATELPATIRTLNMSLNLMLVFNTSNLTIYPQMISLTIRSNPRLCKVLRGTRDNTSFTLRSLDLSHNNISSIQNGSFSSFINLRELVLSGNKLINISADMFEGLNKLKSLNLASNKLRFLNIHLFEDLVSLESLDLSRNMLNYNAKSIPPLLFQNLSNMRQLYLEGNVMDPQPYPNEALSKLSRLTDLFIDVHLRYKFGPQMKTLKNLTTLVFGGQTGICRLRNITKDFLENSPHLTTLIVFGCHLYHIDPDVYTNVKSLETLEISKTSMTYDLYEAFDHLQGLLNSSLKTLRLISLSQSKFLCRALTKEHSTYLQHLPLEELDLSQNRIALIGQDFVKLLPRTLKRLILMDNKLTNRVFSLMGLCYLSELTELYLDRQDDSLESYQLSEMKNDNVNNKSINNSLRSVDPNFKNNEFYLSINIPDVLTTVPSKKQRLCLNSMKQVFESHDDEEGTGCALPPKLKVVQASRFYLFDSSLLSRNWRLNNSLTEITFTNNFLVQWGEGTLPSKILKADFSHNYAMKIMESFFRQNNSLISLTISNNILGEILATGDSGGIFSRLSKLRYLDISMNLIYKLPRGFLSGLKSLEIMLAANNKLQALNLSLSHMSSLRILNFSRNSITWIDRVTRDDLDLLALSTTVALDISFNPLPCTCDGIEILYWMANTNVRLVNQMYLRCQTNTGEMDSVGDLHERAQQVQRACASRAIVLVISITFGMVIVLLVSVALIYRYRWKLRYLQNIALAKCVGFKPKNVFGKNFQYDAYILYEDQTLGFVFRDCIQELEVKRGHRLLLADRDIMPGTYMTSAILSAVQNSYKTIPVVTPYFFDGAFSEYAVKMAVMEEIYEPRQILHLCLYQPTDPEDMSKDLLSIMQRNHYTEFPPEAEMTDELIEHFWNQLSGSIQQRN